jgi:hypothetical protein
MQLKASILPYITLVYLNQIKFMHGFGFRRRTRLTTLSSTAAVLRAPVQGCRSDIEEDGCGRSRW